MVDNQLLSKSTIVLGQKIRKNTISGTGFNLQAVASHMGARPLSSLKSF